jgi:hypothetical protein
MAKAKKGVVPAHLKKYLFTKKGKSSTPSSPEKKGKSSTPSSPEKKSAKRSGVSHMATKKKKGGARRRRGSGSAMSGVLAVIGGAAAAGALRPMLERYLPDSLKTAGNIAGPAVIGGIGYMALKRFNKTAALGWVAATIGVAAGNMAGSALNRSTGVSGFGEPDGIDYLSGVSDEEVAGYLAGEGWEDSVGVQGLGEFEDEYVDV